MSKTCPECGNTTYKRGQMTLCRVVKNLDYQTAIEKVSDYLNRCPDACEADKIDVFEGSTILALMFDKDIQQATEDLLKYRNK